MPWLTRSFTRFDLPPCICRLANALVKTATLQSLQKKAQVSSVRFDAKVTNAHQCLAHSSLKHSHSSVHHSTACPKLALHSMAQHGMALHSMHSMHHILLIGSLIALVWQNIDMRPCLHVNHDCDGRFLLPHISWAWPQTMVGSYDVHRLMLFMASNHCCTHQHGQLHALA